MNRRSLFRILDANFNRLKEALRVIEDVARLEKNHFTLARGAKTLRHETQKILLDAPVTYRDLLKARDSEGDVGRHSRLRDKKKSTVRDLLVSNFKRAEESSRVLEEFFKLISDKTSREFQKLRFKIYQLEKKLI